MVYAYQIFGHFYKDENELSRIRKEYDERFGHLSGLMSWYVFAEEDGEIASVLFICKDKETAENIHKMFGEVQEKYKEDIGFTTEFIFKLVESSFDNA
jgi:hypothetical protein